MKIGGCIVLYNPDAKVVSNIRSYCYGVDVLYVIDNSPSKDPVLVEGICALSEKIAYSWMGGNNGLAVALNFAGRLASEQGCNWLLTMDQDSQFIENDLAGLIAGIGNVESQFGKIGIISPIHLVSEHFIPNGAGKYTEAGFVMTSGNLLNMDAARSIGPFEEKLFIDCIDMDYCLRLRKAGFRIIRDNTSRLKHSLGNFNTWTFMGMKIGYSNHAPVRRYYITRNKIYILKKYFRFDPLFCWLILRSMAGDMVRILFFEKEKGSKFGAVFTGARHAVMNHYGKYVAKGEPI